MWRGRFGRLMNNTEGSIAVICAVAMVGLLGVASVAIDLGHLYTVHNEMQNTVDAAVKAAAQSLLVPDPTNENGVYRDSTAATTAAMNIIQQESQLQGLPTVADGARNDVTINFATWDDKTSTWTDLGASVPTTSPANAVEITLRRAAGTAYGPVTNFFAGILGSGTSNVAATSRAYMGYTYSVYEATVPFPLALPSSVLLAATGEHSWWARLFGPSEAVAQTADYKTYTFYDNGGQYVNTTANGIISGAQGGTDPNQAYWFVCNPHDSVPDSITNMLTEAALTTHTHANSSNSLTTSGRTVYFVDPLAYGMEIYSRSEYMYYASPYYLQNNFKMLQTAFNARKNSSGIWRVTLPVFTGTQYPLGTSQRLDKAFRFLAWLLGPAEAHGCYTFSTPPHIYVNGFVNVDITAVTYTDVSPSSTHCDQCNYTFPKTISGVKYTNKKDCLSRLSASCWNSNSITIKNVRNLSTIIPNSSTNRSVAGEAGGLSNKQINAAAPTGVGAFASIPKLIK